MRAIFSDAICDPLPSPPQVSRLGVRAPPVKIPQLPRGGLDPVDRETAPAAAPGLGLSGEVGGGGGPASELMCRTLDEEAILRLKASGALFLGNPGEG